jgi:hypothetical protein
VDGLDLRRESLADLAINRFEHIWKDQSVLFPWRRACTVKALLVTDGGLDFGDGDFGLSAFVDTLLNDGRSYVRFEITVGHLRSGVSDADVMVGKTGIARSIKGFAFDVASHFTPTMYDQVWLFGIETNFHNGAYPNRSGNTTRYPAGRLGDAELDNLTAHMNLGRGIFATGDHGDLGICLGGSVDRVRNMRYWQDFGSGEVSMGGSRRNDSNAVGHDAGSQFSDQSDDVPQQLDLKLYSAWAWVFREARYPHPVMCSPLGRIDVFPDHPHEGECRTPASLADSCRDGSPEYPNATDGSGQVEPEVVAHGHVPAGNRAIVNNTPLKDATVAHDFGVVSTYDGHRASVGRVVCDSTWHHFVNVNLIGIVEGMGFDDFPRYNAAGVLVSGTPGTHASKHTGFLSSTSGLAVLARIKHYYVNVGVWISPAERITCMNNTLWWELLWNHRLVEATLFDPSQRFHDVSIANLRLIGVHARDVLGRVASPCQTVHFILPYFEEIYIELIPHIDPWYPWPKSPPEPPLPWVDLDPLLDVALGSALVALREVYAYPDETPREFDERAAAIARHGMADGMSRALDALTTDLRGWSRLAATGRKRLDGRLDELAEASAKARAPRRASSPRATKRTARKKASPTKPRPKRR